MPKFEVTQEWSGYSRGLTVYEVEASSEEEARKAWWSGKEIFSETIRDDTETDEITVEEIE